MDPKLHTLNLNRQCAFQPVADYLSPKGDYYRDFPGTSGFFAAVEIRHADALADNDRNSAKDVERLLWLSVCSRFK